MATKITLSSKDPQMKTAAKDRAPGSTPDHLRRRMSQLYADYFSDVGEAVYAKAMAEIKSSLETVLRDGVKELKSKVKDELGRQGYEAAIKHVRPWLDELINDLKGQGFSSGEWAKELNSLATDFSVEADGIGEEGSEELLGVEPPAEEEETVQEVAKEETEPVTESELEKILNQGAQPAEEAAPAEEQKVAAKTLGDMKREFQQRRRQQSVVGGAGTDEVISSANTLIDILEGK
jgi:hypothetical protein